MEIDPLLKKLRIQSDRDEASVPLTLYLPSGRVSGRLTHSDDFYRTSEVQLQQLSEVRSVFALDDDRRGDGDYIHLTDVKSWIAPAEEHSVLRIRLSDVIAWTIGVPE